MNAMNRKNTLGILAASLLAGSMGLANAGDPQAQDRAGAQATESESEQPAGDTWITTKVKAQLLADSDVSGLDISVETVNGVVKLSGDVETQAEADRAVAVAESTEGVTNVDATGINVRANAMGGMH